MKRIVYLTIILTLNFAAITCYSQYRAIRISNAKSLYWQIEIYSGINRSLIQKSSGSAYAIEGLKAMLKQQILENQLYANGGISIEGNRIIKAVLNKNINLQVLIICLLESHCLLNYRPYTIQECHCMLH